MVETIKEDAKSIHLLVDPGLPIIGKAAGATIGSTIGFFLGGPIGIAVGAASGIVFAEIFSRAGAEIDKRYLSNRERARIGAVAFFAISKIEENLQENLNIRSDDFFIQDSISNRSPADEIFEGVLLAAQKEHEELKIKYLGNLYGNIAFSFRVDRAQANFLIKLAANLSYRQLCLLAIFKHKENYHLSRKKLKEIYKTLDQNELSLCLELEELMTQNLLYSKSEFLGQRIPIPSEIDLMLPGESLYDLMNLGEIPLNEINLVARFFENLSDLP